MSSLSLASLGENLQAKIGSGVNKDALNGLVFSLGREGAEALRKGDYETALDRFSACVKVNEKICKPDDINYGASLHNMATALHYLGEIKQAEEFYEKAKAVFERQPSGAFRPSQRHRIKFIEERLTLLRFGAKPANDTYIDECVATRAPGPCARPIVLTRAHRFGVERPTSQRDDPMRETLQLSEKAEKQYWKGVNFAKNKIWGLAQVHARPVVARERTALIRGACACAGVLRGCHCPRGPQRGRGQSRAAHAVPQQPRCRA